jgi:hypothetical protein
MEYMESNAPGVDRDLAGAAGPTAHHRDALATWPPALTPSPAGAAD